MSTIATLFSGGEGVGIGARAAGLHHLWGIEHDADIAAVARANGFDVTVADVCAVDPDSLTAPDVLHASPPCPNFSTAKVGGTESAQDIVLGAATARFIRALRPRFFTLENVWAYRKSKSWAKIAQVLGECGYMFDLVRLDAADFGVPQTRQRMWVRAVRGGLVTHLPAPEPWVGWYAAIEDLLPDLPDDEFAPWQLERMPAELRETVLVAQGAYDDNVVMRRAFVAGATSDGFAIRHAGEPANTVLASNPRRPTRAFVIDGANAGQGVPTIRAGDEPSYTVSASADKAPARAFVGRVVRLSPRCLARVQSFPDWYKLPDNKTLAARIIGNAVPPLLYEKLIRNLWKL